MTASSLLPFAAAVVSLLIAVVSVLRWKRSPAAWSFLVGMAVLGIESLFTGLSLGASDAPRAIHWLTLSFIVTSLVPAIWLRFSLTYSRGDRGDILARWRIPFVLLALLPVAAFVIGGRLFHLVPPQADGQAWRLLFGPAARLLNAVLLVALVVTLTNLEQTFRSAVGTMRWRIKFVVLALAVILGARLYVRAQAILFSAPDTAFWSIESGSLLIGCVFLAVAYVRTGLTEIDVYPSLAVLRSSLTVVLVGGYLLIVGVLAQLVRRFGGAEIFQFQAFVVLAGMSGLAVLLLSDRARQRVDLFVGRHFRKAQHDSVRVWTLVSRQLASVKDSAGLCAVCAKLISETFEVLSVTIWLFDRETGQLVRGVSTSQAVGDATGALSESVSSAVLAGLRVARGPFDVETIDDDWAGMLRRASGATFPNGGNRLCIPLRSGEEILGAIVLADRVSGAIYTVEELALLACIGDQVTSVLLNLRLAGEVVRARELEAFRTMSAFFVHDLKNAAATLKLTLTNLPVHFDDAAFRADALRTIANTLKRIDETIARLTALRERPAFIPVAADLNQLVDEVLDRVDGLTHVDLTRDLHPVPGIVADPEQIRSVVTNLVLNARDAVGAGGAIRVRTERRNDRVVLSVADNGCGMTQAFVRESLFRPFRSTKKSGLGIGLFQAQTIVQAHGGTLHVQSETGKGTTFEMNLPATGGQS